MRELPWRQRAGSAGSAGIDIARDDENEAGCREECVGYAVAQSDAEGEHGQKRANAGYVAKENAPDGMVAVLAWRSCLSEGR